MLFQRNKVQGMTGLRIASPGLPGRQEIDPQSKAGFRNDKMLPPLPTRRQIVARQKNMSGLRNPAARGVVNITVKRRKRRPVRSKIKRCWFEIHPAGNSGNFAGLVRACEKCANSTLSPSFRDFWPRLARQSDSRRRGVWNQMLFPVADQFGTAHFAQGFA